MLRGAKRSRSIALAFHAGHTVFRNPQARRVLDAGIAAIMRMLCVLLLLYPLH